MKSIPSISELFQRHKSPDKSTPEVVLAVIREAIVTGSLASGATVKQDEIADLCNISKSPVREALKSLEPEGFILSYKNRGFVVAPVSRAEMNEIFQVRSILEPFAMQLAMPMITEKDIQQAERFVDELEGISETDASWTYALNLRFHMAIYEPSEAKHLLSMIRHAHYVSHRYVHAAYWMKNVYPQSQDQHRSIIKACRARDVEWAKELLIKHMTEALEQLSADIGDLLPENRPAGRREQ